jgi:HSP20 family molecular chaperone IbpA
MRYSFRSHECRYEIKYAHHVGTEDIYLGLSGSMNSVNHCNTFSVEIKLPGVKQMSEITLNVTETQLEVATDA